MRNTDFYSMREREFLSVFNHMNTKRLLSPQLGQVFAEKSPRAAYYFALYVLGERFPEGEEMICKDLVYARIYAENCLGMLALEAYQWVKQHCPPATRV